MKSGSIFSSKKYEDGVVTALRLSLALIFLWFGALKILGHNPVSELIEYSMAPFLAAGGGLVLLGFLEATIGVLLLTNRFLMLTHVILLLHLLGTFSTFIFGWHVVFAHFPVLTLEGEFVVKNVILILAGLTVLVHEGRKRSRE